MTRLLLLPLLALILVAPLSTNLLEDAGFDLCWIWNPYWVPEGGSDQIWCDGIVLPLPPQSGEGVALQCYDRDNCHDKLYQAVDLSEYEQTDLMLCFSWQIRTMGQSDMAADFCSVHLRDENGTDLGELFVADNTTPTDEWKRACTTFRHLGVEMARISFEADTDSTGETWCVWDTVALIVPDTKYHVYLPGVRR